MSKVYTVIVTYNSMRWAEKCFESLQASSLQTIVVVIDNGSSDGTVEFVKEHYPRVHLIETRENLGFAKANNIGIRYAIDNGAKYVFLLNHDAWVERDTLSSLLRTMSSGDRVGIVSPIHLTGDYQEIDKPFLSFMPQSFHEDKEHNALKSIYEVDFVNAAAWLMNVEMIKEVGGFDTLLFKHYGEDENLCQRIRYFGWKIEIDSSTTICHDRFKRVQNGNYKEGALGQHAYEIGAKVSMGDITKDVPIIYHIVRQFILTIVWYILQDPERATIHKNLQYSYCLARKSRKINKRGGLLWL